jgi:integrase
MVTRSNLVFPILLRILYGSGLRINECCSLRWQDLDLDNGILTICKAKNLKQRFVPIDSSLTETLRIYHKFVLRQKMCGDYLFESDRNPDNPFRTKTFEAWFKKVLEKTDIKYISLNRHERGVCPHCLRHTFTLKSFLKQEELYDRFEDYAPFLAEYLGHDGPIETEEYLRSNYTVYTKSHQRVNAAIGNLFPEVCFEEEI